MTARAARGLPTLRAKGIVRRIEGFRRGCERADFRLVHYSIQGDHVHLVVEAADPRALGRGVRSMLIRIARAANGIWLRRGAVFADRYHHRRLSTPREVRNAIAYVLRNARKHFCPCTKSDWIDPARSGRWFWARACDAPAVATPRSWLLRVGWTRHGSIPI